MRRGEKIGARARERSRGVAVLELSLSLVFLVPLLLATLDFGYYFFVATSAEEAARQGAAQAASLGGTCATPPDCQVNIGNIVTNVASGTGTNCVGVIPLPQPPAAACYMNGPPLGMGASGGGVNVTCRCLQVPVNPTYRVEVRVDFVPAVGFFKYLMPAGAAGKVRYTTTATATP